MTRLDGKAYKYTHNTKRCQEKNLYVRTSINIVNMPLLNIKQQVMCCAGIFCYSRLIVLLYLSHITILITLS
jgi:hypothetical protein